MPPLPFKLYDWAAVIELNFSVEQEAHKAPATDSKELACLLCCDNPHLALVHPGVNDQTVEDRLSSNLLFSMNHELQSSEKPETSLTT